MKLTNTAKIKLRSYFWRIEKKHREIEAYAQILNTILKKISPGSAHVEILTDKPFFYLSSDGEFAGEHYTNVSDFIEALEEIE